MFVKKGPERERVLGKWEGAWEKMGGSMDFILKDNVMPPEIRQEKDVRICTLESPLGCAAGEARGGGPIREPLVTLAFLHAAFPSPSRGKYRRAYIVNPQQGSPKQWLEISVSLLEVQAGKIESRCDISQGRD